MNTREQYLQKQVARQAAQIETLMAAFKGVLVENEVQASVACAFAWDAVRASNERELIGTMTYPVLLSRWDEAVKAVGG